MGAGPGNGGPDSIADLRDARVDIHAMATVKPFVLETSLWKISAGIGAIFHEINRFVLFPISNLGK